VSVQVDRRVRFRRALTARSLTLATAHLANPVELTIRAVLEERARCCARTRSCAAAAELCRPAAAVRIKAHMNGSTPARILVVDDDPRVRTVLAELLELAGYAVLQADGGSAAIAQLDDPSIALVVSDIRMPRCSGLAVLAAARAQRPGLPVILATGAATAAEREQAAAAGAPVLDKPIAVGELEQVVADALQQAR
jgi:CheY-like chemotaxis protein